MDEQSRDTCEFTGLQRSQNRVTQKPATYAPTLPISIDRQPPDNHDGNGTEAFRLSFGTAVFRRTAPFKRQ
nr:hypothetical protein [Acidisoma sp. S159]